jgi:predicted aldo/keto reductase-like oxidoreductase
VQQVPPRFDQQAIRAAEKQDMGIFIISASDKGGMLYKPSGRLVETTAPFSPLAFNDLWLWTHAGPQIHTLVVGAARPGDFNEHVEGEQQGLPHRGAEVDVWSSCGLCRWWVLQRPRF